MTHPETAKAAWQESAAEATPPTLDAIRTGADHFYRQIRRRNRIEYAACALVIPCFTAYTFLLPSPVARIGAFLVVLATLFMAWRLHRHASVDAPPEVEAARPLIEHQRAQFVRQRDALASVWRWYLLPFAPGMGLMVFAPAVERGTRGLLEMGMGGMDLCCGHSCGLHRNLVAEPARPPGNCRRRSTISTRSPTRDRRPASLIRRRSGRDLRWSLRPDAAKDRPEGEPSDGAAKARRCGAFHDSGLRRR